MKLPSILDVARVAGVSKSTVSRVLNADPAVKQETRDIVTRVMNTLNYRPNVSARSMGSARSYWVALLYQNPGIHYIHLLQQGAMARCREGGHMLSVHACDQIGLGLVDEVLGIVDQLQPFGIVLTTPMCDIPPILAALRKRGVPFVRVGPTTRCDGAPLVSLDEVAAAREMTEYLIALGHRDIAFIGGLPPGVENPRQEGFLAAMKAARLKVPKHRIGFGSFDLKQGAEWALQLLDNAARPTAIMAASDDMAVGCLHAARALKLVVPRDLSVSGFDDSYVAQLALPRLTTVHQPLHEMAHVATDLIIKGLAAPSEWPPRVILPHRLVVGESTAAAPKASQQPRSAAGRS